MAKKEKPILTLKGDLIWAGNDIVPKPGKTKFIIKGADDGEGKILLEREISIRRDALPEVVTKKHIRGKIIINFHALKPDNAEYEKNVKDEASIRTRKKAKK